jgi:hypothetical protein
VAKRKTRKSAADVAVGRLGQLEAYLTVTGRKFYGLDALAESSGYNSEKDGPTNLE